MGCQATHCKGCNNLYQACQLHNGLCANCIAKQEAETKVSQKKVKISPELLENIEINGHS